VVRSPAAQSGPERRAEVAQAAATFAIEARHRGATLDQALDAVRRAFAQTEEGRA
jgi:hypothetical protein